MHVNLVNSFVEKKCGKLKIIFTSERTERGTTKAIPIFMSPAARILRSQLNSNPVGCNLWEVFSAITGKY